MKMEHTYKNMNNEGVGNYDNITIDETLNKIIHVWTLTEK